MDQILSLTETKMQEATEKMNARLSNVRAGRANPAILDRVMVDYYGTLTPLNQLANVSIPEARQLMIKPFDKSTLGDFEKAIYEANIGLTPNNNGEVIILNIPALTEETRKEYVKQVKKIGEENKIILRNIRQDSNNEIKKLEAPEDEKKYLNENVQELINKYNKLTDEVLKAKEIELMSV